MSKSRLDLPLESVWAKRSQRLSTVLTREKVRQVIAQLTGVRRLYVCVDFVCQRPVTEPETLREGLHTRSDVQMAPAAGVKADGRRSLSSGRRRLTLLRVFLKYGTFGIDRTLII